MSVHSGRSAALALSKGARATFAFNGTAAKWIGYKDPGERVDDFFGKAVAEVFVLFVRAHIRERQNGDRWLQTGGIYCDLV